MLFIPPGACAALPLTPCVPRTQGVKLFCSAHSEKGPLQNMQKKRRRGSLACPAGKAPPAGSSWSFRGKIAAAARKMEINCNSVNIYRVKLHNFAPLFFCMFAKSPKILEIAENKLQKPSREAIIRFNLVNQRSASRGFVPGLLPIWGEAEPSINNLCEGSE